MKKYISLFSFIALLFVGTQSFAQEARVKKQTPEAIAKQSTHDMHQVLNLSGEQQGSVFRALVDAEQNMQAIDANGGDVKSIQLRKDAVRKNLEIQMKAILSAEQYQAYSELKKRKQ